MCMLHVNLFWPRTFGFSQAMIEAIDRLVLTELGSRVPRLKRLKVGLRSKLA